MMWANVIMLLPIASVLSTVTVKEEFKMEGDLQDAVASLIKKHVPSLRFKRNNELQAYINVYYPENTNLWTVFDGILERYKLILDFHPVDGVIEIELKHGAAWTH